MNELTVPVGGSQTNRRLCLSFSFQFLGVELVCFHHSPTRAIQSLQTPRFGLINTHSERNHAMSLAYSTDERPTVPMQPQQFSWVHFWAISRVVVWYGITIPVMGLLYVTMIAEGIRIKFPFWAIPLYKIRGMPKWMDQYDIFHRFDLAIPASFGLLFLVWLFWDYLLQLWIAPDDFRVRSRQKPEVYKSIVVVLGVALLLLDSYLFYSAMSYMGWGGKFSATALLATIGYAAALIAVALISINLRQDVRDLKQENQP